MAQLPNTATIKDIITSLQTMQCINQKADLASVVGSPAASTDDVATIITKIQNAKNTLATNIKALGNTASGTEGLAALASKVSVGSGLKRWASGSQTTYTNGQVHGVLEITGLSFKPSIVFCQWYHAAHSTSPAYVLAGYMKGIWVWPSRNPYGVFVYNSTTWSNEYCSISDSGFRQLYYAPETSTTFGYGSIEWYAFE